LYVEVAVSQTDYTDTGVVNGVTYFYTVTAVTEVGEGPQATPLNALANWNAMDFNGDGIINTVDFVLFAQEWLWQATWAGP